jgi:hypothetical protein
MKKLALSLLSVVILYVSATAQNQPDVEVVKFSWHKLTPHKAIPSGKQAQQMRNVYRDVQIADENRKPPQEQDISTIIRLENEKRNQVTPLDAPAGTNKPYEYKFSFKNHGTKEVIGMRWAYVFRDASTQKQLVAHGFNTDAKIKPGKKKSVTSYTDSSPPMIVNADAQKKKGKPWSEEVIITAVFYADGSKWERR